MQNEREVMLGTVPKVHTRHGSQLEHESAQLLSQMLVISLLSLFPSFSIINSVS
ncbi:hypothetical protein GBAR_LOCUS17859 [Geodia barretti]|uniref:Uncharacterized protein n=1 Tax=Geodia barretti TaxID=519541 RepID=A0AA35SKW0_GEOBA|nr:hypothetical protein GBAR_LOCUS17859 [Geodia barretti]